MKNNTKVMSPRKNKIKTVKKKISPSQKFLLSKKSKEISKKKLVLKGSATLHKRVEEAAKKASVEWQTTFDAVNDAICLLDVDNHIKRCNRTMNEIFGITQEELLGRHCWEIVHGTTEPIPDCPVSKVKSSLQLEKMEIQIKGKWLNIIAYPVLDNSHVLIAIVHIIRDITDRKEAEEKLQENERQYRLLTEKMSDIVWIADMNLRTTYVSPSVKNILGFSQEERMRQTLNEQLTPNSLSLVLDVLSKELTLEKQGNADPNRTLKIELEYYHKDGSTHWMELVISGLRNDQGVLTGIHGVARDITERKKAEDELKESEKKYRLLAENIQDVVFVMDMNLNYTYISPSVKILRGYEPEEALKHTPAETLTPSSVDLALRALSEIMEIEESEHKDINISRTLQLEMSRKDGTTFWVEMKASFIRDEHQRPVGIMGLTRDITERKKAEDELRESELRYRELSIIDDLTQLYNSRHFYTLLEREMERSNRYEQPLTILMLDIDKFKAFNDTYGHIEGDYVLSRLGQMVKRCLRETDSAYRYGGEEFMIMLPMTTSDEGIVTAKRIQTELRKEKFSPVLSQEVYITVSIGIAQYKPNEEMKAFVQRVDQLMYQAKKNGRDRICPES